MIRPSDAEHEQSNAWVREWMSLSNGAAHNLTRQRLLLFGASFMAAYHRAIYISRRERLEKIKERQHGR